MGIDVSELPGVQVRPRVWYNPELKSANFMIPGIIGIVLYFLTALLTSMSIVREREQGTIEQLIVTPIKPLELIVAKITPYVFISFFDVLEVLAVGVFWFGVPIRGSLGLLLGLSALFLLSSLGIGILISSIANTQQEAMLLAFLTMLPSIFLGGFLFPYRGHARLVAGHDLCDSPALHADHHPGDRSQGRGAANPGPASDRLDRLWHGRYAARGLPLSQEAGVRET